MTKYHTPLSRPSLSPQDPPGLTRHQEAWPHPHRAVKLVGETETNNVEAQEVGNPKQDIREGFLEEVYHGGLGARRERPQGWKE